MTTIIRAAITADFTALLGEPLPWRVRALTVEHDGAPVGVGGLAFLPDGTVAAFVHAEANAQRFRITIHKAGLRVMRDAMLLGIHRVVAMADPEIAAAVPWLKRLGFEETIIDGERIYEWRTPLRSGS